MIEQGEVNHDQIRFYIGYSGWSGDQLAQELEGNTWLTHNSSYHDLMRTSPESLWSKELIKINPAYKAFTDFSFDPSLN